jgi:hypothetical protein
MDKMTVEEARAMRAEREERLERLYIRILQENEVIDNVCHEESELSVQV